MSLLSKNQPEVPRRRQAAERAAQRLDEQTLDQRYAFRRNRNLTGSASSSVSSTNESQSQLQSARVQAHSLAQQRRNLAIVLAAVVMACIILFILVSQFTSRVVLRSADSAITKFDPTYAQAIDDYLTGQPVERLRFMLDQERLNAYVRSVAPEVLAVEVGGAAGVGASSFVITMRQPIAGWSIDGGAQYVDATGSSFTRNYYGAPAVQIIDNSGVQAVVGQAVASDQFLSFVGRVVGVAATNGFVVTQVIIPQGTTRQVEVSLKDVQYPIKLSVDRSVGEQLEDMSRAVKWLSANGQSPEYLDVRVSRRAFYR